MVEVTLKADYREGVGKSHSRRLRREGRIPGIFYTAGEEAIPVAVDRKEFYTVVTGEVSIVDLEFSDGKRRPGVIRDIQWDPVTMEPLHVDFLGVKYGETVTVDVHIHLKGTPNGVKNQGGVLQFNVRTVTIEVLPKNIPDHIEIDVSDLNVHDSITVADMDQSTYKIVDDPDTVICTVLPARVEAELPAEEALEEEEAEPEVVGKEKKAESEESEE